MRKISLCKKKGLAQTFSWGLLIHIVLLSCQNNQPPTLLTNEGSEPKKEIVEIDPYEEEYYEFKLFEKSNFAENQIKPDLVYVFTGECAMYEDESRERVIAYLNVGTPLAVLQKGDEHYRDSTTNAYGSLWLVEYQSRIGYVFSGFVSKMPYPKKPNLSFIEYGKTYLHLIDSVEHSGYKSPYADDTPSDSESESLTYKFEHGIVISKHTGYESVEQSMSIPGLTVEEGFYILQAFGMVDLFAYFENRIPDYEMDWDYQRPMIDYMTGEAHVKEDGRLNFVGALADGCGNWYYVDLTDEGISLVAGGGC